MLRMFCLDGIDAVILLAVAGVGVFIIREDIRSQSFPFGLWLLFTGLGISWCWKQSFIPLALVPLGLGMGCIFLYNHFVREILGSGDLLLFLSSGLFLPMDDVSLFAVLSGALGLVGFASRRLLHKREARIPFAGSILVALALTFCTSLLEEAV